MLCLGEQNNSDYARPLAVRYHEKAGEKERVLYLIYYPIGEAGSSISSLCKQILPFHLHSISFNIYLCY